MAFQRARIGALVGLALVGVTLCVLLMANAPQPVEMEAEATEYFDALETKGPYHNSYVRAPTMQQLVGHDHNPNDNSLRVHLLSKFVQHRLQEEPPQKQELNGLWQRLAYARRVLGKDADEILGPKKRDRDGNILVHHHENEEERERRANDDSFVDHLKHSSSRLRELNRLRRLLRSKYHLDNKREALAIAERHAQEHGRGEQRRAGGDREERYGNNNEENRWRDARQSQSHRDEERQDERNAFAQHPGAARALEGLFHTRDFASGREQERSRSHERERSVIEQGNSNIQEAKPQLLHQYVDDDSSQKLVIEGGPISPGGPVAVVGWLHRDHDGDWAGKLFPKNSPAGQQALHSPEAGSKGWFDGTITAQQRKSRLVSRPAPAAPAAPAVVEAPISEVPANAVAASSQLSQPLYDVVPEVYSSASLDPQLNTPVNEFELEPGLQIN